MKNKYYVRSSLVLMVFMTILNTASAEVKPTIKEAKNVLLEHFKSEVNNKLLQINKVEKTDGQDIKMAVSLYLMYVNAELVFMNDTALCYGFTGVRFIPAVKYKAMGELEKMGKQCTSALIFNAGEILKIPAKITFEKSEKGWRNGQAEIEWLPIITELAKSKDTPQKDPANTEKATIELKSNIKNAYTAAQACFMDHPKSTIDSSEQLKKCGYKPSTNVQIVFINLSRSDGYIELRTISSSPSDEYNTAIISHQGVIKLLRK